MKKILHLIGIGTAGLFVAGAAAFYVFDGMDYVNYARAEEARERKDYTAAWAIMMPLAEKGFALAQFRAGRMRYAGHGVERSTDEALKWLKRAARQNEINAMGFLGTLYWLGVDLKHDRVHMLLFHQIL